MSYFEVSKNTLIDHIVAFRVTTKWASIEVISEEYVVLTNFGYVPTLLVKVDNKEIPRALHIGAKSIAIQRDEMRKDNGFKFTGLKFDLRKASEDKRSPYEFR